MVRGRGSRGFVPQDPGQRGGFVPRGRGRGGRGGRGGPAQNVRRPDLQDMLMDQSYEEIDFNDFGARQFAPSPRGGFNSPRGGRGYNNRGRGARGGPNPQFTRRPDLVDEIMNQVEELDDDDFNFGISFKPLSADTPSPRRGRGDWRGRDTPGSGRGRGRGSSPYAYSDDYIVGSGGPRRGTPQRMRGSGLGFASPPGGSTPVKSVPGAVIDPAKLPDYGRPLLRPIIFIRSTLHKTLFQEVDEVIQAHDIKLDDDSAAEVEVDEPPSHAHHPVHDPALSHAPTADRVAAVFGSQEDEADASFNTTSFTDTTSTSDDEADESELQLPSTPKAILAPVLEHTTITQSDSAATVTQATTMSVDDMELEKLKISDSPEASRPAVEANHDTDMLKEAVAFIIDTTGSVGPPQDERIIVNDTSHLQPLGDDDEIILFNPPSRTSKSKPSTPAPPTTIPQLPNVDTAVANAAAASAVTSSSVELAATTTTAAATMTVNDVSFASLSQAPPVPVDDTNAKRAGPGKLSQLKHRVNSRKAERRRLSFGMRGALLEEARTRQEAIDKLEERRGPLSKKAKRGLVDTRGRAGGRDADSDLDWGTDNEDGEAEADENVFTSNVASSSTARERDGPDSSLASMDVDPDLVEIDEGVFARFAKGLGRSANGGGGQHVTIDDLQDAAKLAAEDEDDSAASAEGEEEEDSETEEFDSEDENKNEDGLEAIMSDEESDEVTSDDEDEDLDGVGSFDARLKKIRARQKKADVQADSEEDDDDDVEGTKAEGDEAFLAHIQKLIEENSTILKGGGKRKKGKTTFEDVLNGDFELDESEEQYFPERVRRKAKGKTFTDAKLQEQWERDRLAKAELKRQREKERAEMQAAALSPRMAKQLGKRFKKENRNKGATTGETLVRAGAVTDFPVIEAEIRGFVRDIGGKASMALPPLDKASRARVHLIAQSFGLKSKSTGGGEARFITLYRTSRTREKGVNESKVKRLVYGGALKGGQGGKILAPRHKEGDEVGKAAPKLTEENLGYRLLQQMGWAEGDRIGLSTQGLEVPISAFIKTTKLGLGASFSR
ncbi:hypothetical protein EXIGLDRAFT_717163 [Exidia glandulosa HHB12029]|uniref:Protein SQS1 n=1 Tax=Exidia glandulosa HHB12029 TaxID=1314781 RepID=A0A166AMI6_EXIGL|nr:hypothetical protein EXIGLDRAFT_717163 [Exidia glandulosa HHB12029]